MGLDASPSATAGRCRCGRDLEPGDRYCSSCGSVTGAWTESDRSLLLEPAGADDRSARPIEVVTGNRTGWLLLGVALVALAMWGLFRWPAGTEAEPDGGTGPDLPSETPARTELPIIRTPPSITGPEPGALGDAVAAFIGQVPGRSRPGPVLGEPTGLGVVVGSLVGDRRVEILDLDTGRIDELAGVEGQPVGSSGSTLVVERGDSLAVVDLSRPEPAAVPIRPAQPGWSHVVDIDGDRLWVVEGLDDGYATALVGYALDGTPVDRVELGSLVVGFGAAGSAGLLYTPAERFELGSLVVGFGAGGTAELLYTPAGGIYRRDGDTYRRIAGGMLLAAGDELALVYRCAETLACDLQWYRMDPWEPIELPPAETSPLRGSTQIVGGDRWLLTYVWAGGRAELREIASGQLVRRWVVSFDGRPDPGARISADGRWLLDRSAHPSVVVDLDSPGAAREWPVDLPERAGASYRFVDLSAGPESDP